MVSASGGQVTIAQYSRKASFKYSMCLMSDDSLLYVRQSIACHKTNKIPLYLRRKLLSRRIEGATIEVEFLQFFLQIESSVLRRIEENILRRIYL